MINQKWHESINGIRTIYSMIIFCKSLRWSEKYALPAKSLLTKTIFTPMTFLWRWEFLSSHTPFAYQYQNDGPYHFWEKIIFDGFEEKTFFFVLVSFSWVSITYICNYIVLIQLVYVNTFIEALWSYDNFLFQFYFFIFLSYDN